MSYLGLYRPVVLSAVNSDIVPQSDDTYTLGNSNKRFKTAHVTDTVTAGAFVIPNETGFLKADGTVSAGGSGNMNFSGSGSIGKHYVQSSSDGFTCVESDLKEDVNGFSFGSQDVKNINSIEVSNSTDTVNITPSQISTAPTKNLTVLSGNFLNLYGENITASATNNININSDFVNINTGNMMINSDTILTDSNITANAFIKAGSSNQQYLMGDGSVLQQSAVSGNSNFYLYTNIPFGLIPIGNGFVSYNNPIQKDATVVYINTITRDDISISVYMQQIGLLNDIYIQAQAGTDFIRYNITAEPQFIDSYLQVNVVATDYKGQGETSFGNDTQLMVSFFSNLTEIDTRITGVEGKTQNITAVSGNTTFSGNIDLNNNELSNVSKITTNGGTFNVGSNNSNTYTSTNFNVLCGNNNSITNNEQIIFGYGNSILSNQTVVIGSSNANINTGLGNVIGHGNSVIASIANVMGYNNTIGNTENGYFTQCIGSNNICNGLYASAIGSDITNNTPNSLCLGDSSISTIFPNSSVCDLGNATKPFKDIYYTGNLISPSSKLDLNYINSFFIGIQFQHGSGSLTLLSNSLWTAIGGTSSAFQAYAITNNFTRQLACGFWQFVSPQDGAVCGYTSTATTGIQVSTGYQWGLYTALGIADTGAPLSNSQNFWGLNNTATAPPLSSSVQLSTRRNMICFGNATADNNLCIYTAGALSTVKQVDLGIDFPSNRTSGADPTIFYRLAIYWDGTKIYYKAINTTTNITAQGSFTPLSTDMPLSSISLYPQCLRIQGTPSATTGARLKVQRFGVFY